VVAVRWAWLLVAGAAACSSAAPSSLCYEAKRASDVAGDVRERLARGGFRDIVVAPHPALPGRWIVRASGLTGKIEETSPACAGALLSLWRVPVAAAGAGSGRRTAGPLGPRRTRIPQAP